MRSTLARLMLAALVCNGMAPAHGSLRQRFARPSAGDLLFGGQDIAYGGDPMQRLCFWGAARTADRPASLILFVHGGGWKRGDRVTATGPAKLDHFRARGYAFATINYHLVPARGSAQARGLARALQRAGTPVEIAATGGRGLEGHIAINRQLGQPADPATRVVDAWLRSLFGR